MDYQAFASSTINYLYCVYNKDGCLKEESTELLASISRIADVSLEDIRNELMKFHDNDEEHVDRFIAVIKENNRKTEEMRQEIRKNLGYVTD